MQEQAGLWGISPGTRMNSSSSTPYESAACSPRSSTDRAASSYYSVSAPTYPLTITRSLPATGIGFVSPSSDASCCEEPSSDDFDFSARFSETDPPWSSKPMSSADELFYNGKIRPLGYNCEDLIHSPSDYANKRNGDDEDNHFDFRSSADYKFSMFSAVHSPTSAMNKLQRYVGYRNNGQYCVHSHGQVSREDAGEVQSTKRIVQKWRAYSGQGPDEMITKQAMVVKVEESRGRRAGGNKEGGIRRTRSLSPLRVFHMDDELPRQSFETRWDEHEEKQGTQKASGKGKRLTLRELLHSRSQAEQKQGEKQQNIAFMDMETERKMKEKSAFCFKSSEKQALNNKLKGSNHTSQHLPGHQQASMSPHGLHYASQRVRTEQIRQQTFLPYRQGLFGCLGFTSKSYRSVAGIRAFHSKSQGMRRSTGYDSSNL